MNKTIMTAVGRIIWPNLVTPQMAKNGQGAAKFGVTMLFPKNGICTVTGTPVSGISEVQAAIDEVCMAEWNMPAANVPAALNIPNAFRIKDGDTQFMKKDKATDLPLNPPQILDGFAGNHVMSFRNAARPGCAQPSATPGIQENIGADQVYSGCWAKVQVEIAAYKGAHGFVLSATLLNVLKAYDDSPLGGGKTAQQASTDAFAGVTIEGTNIQAGTGVISADAATALANATVTAPASTELVITATAPNTLAELRGIGWTDEQIIAAGYATKPTPPPVATPPTPPVATPPVSTELVITATAPNTLAELRGIGWTDEQIVAAGYATKPVATPPTPPAVVTPPPAVVTPPPAVVTPPPAPQTVATPPPAPQTVATPPPAPQTVAAPPTPPASGLTMTATAPNTYAELKGAGWSDTDMVTAGYAEAPNFRDPAQGTPPPPPPAA